MANECFILNSTNLAAIFAQDGPKDYQNLKATLPPWILFYTVAGYEYFPEEGSAHRLKTSPKSPSGWDWNRSKPPAASRQMRS